MVRYLRLSQYYWFSIEAVNDFTTPWTWSDDHDRPHTALGGFSPKQYLGQGCTTDLLLGSVKIEGITT